MSDNNMPHRMLKAKGANTTVFVNLDDREALDAIRARHGNRDLAVSAASYAEADPSSPCIVWLYFYVTCICIEQMRQSVLEAVYYIADNFGIPPEFMYLIYNGGGIATEDNRGADADTTAPAQTVILVPPSVFDGRPTPLMPALNYDLARQMREDSIAVEIDVYSQEQQFAPLNDAVVGATGRFAVLLRVEELLYVDPERILSLSKQSRADDFFAVGNPVPEAAEWFAEVLGTAEKRQKQQLHLRQVQGAGSFLPA